MNKSIDLMKRMGNYPNNFLAEMDFSSTNNSKLVSINETNAKRLIDRHSNNGFIAISPCRGYEEFGIDENSPNKNQLLSQANKPRIQDMINRIKNSGFSYTPVFGGFIENKGEENEEVVYERSFIIYPYDKQGNLRDFNELKEFGLELTNIYNQDSFLVKAPNESPCYIKKDGSIDFEPGNNIVFNDFAQQYFTDLHKNTSPNSKSSKPTRFTYLETYINPKPCSYNESYKRYFMGEVFIGK